MEPGTKITISSREAYSEARAVLALDPSRWLIRAKHREEEWVWVVGTVVAAGDETWRVAHVHSSAHVVCAPDVRVRVAGTGLEIAPAALRVETNADEVFLLATPPAATRFGWKKRQEAAATAAWGSCRADASLPLTITSLWPKHELIRSGITAFWYRVPGGGETTWTGTKAGGVLCYATPQPAPWWFVDETGVVRAMQLERGQAGYVTAVLDGPATVPFDPDIARDGDVLYAIGRVLPADVRRAIARDYANVLSENKLYWGLLAACMQQQ